MKKFIIAAITVITLVTSAIAAEVSDSKTVALFKAAYPGATNVHYKPVGELISISFVLDSTSMQAFYSQEGEQVALSRTVNYQQLPSRARAAIQNKYSTYTVTEVIALEHITEDITYYVSLESNNQKVIAQVSVSGEVSVFKKSSK